MKAYPDGAVRRQYWCQPRAHDGGCGRIAIDQRELDRHGRKLWSSRCSPIRGTPPRSNPPPAPPWSCGRRSRREEIIESEALANALAERLGRGEIALTRYDAATGRSTGGSPNCSDPLGQLATAPDAAVPPEVIAASRAEWERR